MGTVVATLKIEGIEETIAGFEKLPPEIYKAIEEALMRGAIKVTNRAKDICPYKTGTLRRSIRKEKGDEPLEILVGTDVKYAEAMEYGATIPPHIVLPRLTQRFVGKGKKKRLLSYITKAYMHPGAVIRARPFLEPALFECEDDINKDMQDNVINVIKKAGAEVEP